MNENVKIVFGLLGGLAMFLYGMNTMSDSLQKAAGEKMKRILGFLTKNPIMGAVAGAIVTAVLQSSSATTVMVIGFVSAGLMSLPQAISVIFGANIGTTMTAQLLAFKISDYVYPIIFVGFILSFLFKKEKVKNIGMVIFSFGLLFEGIEVMGSVMKPLATSEVFTDLMGKVSSMPILGVFLGAIMTLVVQSSSATIAVLQNFASQPAADGVSSVIGLTGAIPILFGDNIGTTITALLASIGQTKNAKRTAFAHSIFNISGTILFMFFIPVLAKFVQFISPKGDEIDVISRQIANAHTTFNVVCTLIWLPLIPLMVKIVKLIVRGEDKKPTEKIKPAFLDDKLIGQPLPAMYLVSEEIERLYGLGMDFLKSTKDYIIDLHSKENPNTLYTTIHTLEENISNYINRMLSSGSLTETQAEQTAGLLYVTNNIERISDRCKDICDTRDKIIEKKGTLSKDAISDLISCFGTVEKLYEDAMYSVCNGNTQVAQTVSSDKPKVRNANKKFEKSHYARVKKNECSADLTAVYADILYNIDRISDNCVCIAEEAIDNVSFVTIEKKIQETGKFPVVEA